MLFDGQHAGVVPLPRHANAGCVDDGRHLENIVFPEKPASGSYLVYVNLHDACHESTVHYTLTRSVRAGSASSARRIESASAGGPLPTSSSAEMRGV